MSYITAIGCANPPNRFSQKIIAGFMEKAMNLEPAEARKLQAVFRASGIEHRHSVLQDYGRNDSFSFYPNTPDFEPFPSTAKRLEAFREHALTLSLAAIDNMVETSPAVNRRDITHLITVSCTGLYAPGLDIELVQKLGLASSVQRTSITFMGCYAAFNALKAADAFCRSNNEANVLIVCTELCSLHFQKAATDDNLLANALFADGAAAICVQPKPTGSKSLSLEAFHNDLALEGQQDMAWQVGDLGFEMKLSAYVPTIIEKGISDLTKSLLRKIKIDIPAIKYYAIHPGGRKILEAIEHAIGITHEQNKYAYDVLRQYGNMSSPTVLFVLREIFSGITPADNDEHILSFAFGPGLTMESMLLKICTSHA
jgi:predicted naringenin-chalcone synthase